MFFRHKQQDADTAKKEAEIHAIHADMYKKIERATEKTDKLIELLENEGVTGRIFLATGGLSRMGKRQ